MSPKTQTETQTYLNKRQKFNMHLTKLLQLPGALSLILLPGLCVWSPQRTL